MTDGKKRWYDADPVIAEAIRVWQRLPLALQRVIADYVNRHTRALLPGDAVEGAEDQVDLAEGFLSGADMVKIYNVAQKRRWHDVDPVIRSAVNAMALLDTTENRRIARRILKVRDLLQDHLKGGEALPADVLTAMHTETVLKILQAED